LWFIRREFADQFHIAVASYPEFHPESPSAEKDLEFFRRKVAAGADSSVTQYFYNADSYFRFVDDCRRMGMDIPITPGIMPITNYLQRRAFHVRAEIPSGCDAGWRLGTICRDPGVWPEVVARLCEHLQTGGAPGLQFYPLNRANASLMLCSSTGAAEVCINRSCVPASRAVKIFDPGVLAVRRSASQRSSSRGMT
jgi:methylenetetrahydrofolate reductase (NADPH)